MSPPVNNISHYSPKTLTPQHFPDKTLDLLPSEVANSSNFTLVANPNNPIRAWFSDMDGTLFNGKAPVKNEANAVLAHLVGSLQAVDIPLIYITGRRIENVNRAIQAYKLPLPSFVAASVGTMIFKREDDRWQEVTDYSDQLRSHWVKNAEEKLDQIMKDAQIQGCIHSSETEFRRSYIADPAISTADLNTKIVRLLKQESLDAIKVIVSGPGNEGYLHIDFLPDNGSKVDAGRFIAANLLGLGDLSSVLFTGDSGNDKDLLLSAGFSTLVQSSENGLVESLSKLSKKTFISQQPNIYGVVHSMIHFGLIEARVQ